MSRDFSHIFICWNFFNFVLFNKSSVKLCINWVSFKKRQNNGKAFKLSSAEGIFSAFSDMKRRKISENIHVVNFMKSFSVSLQSVTKAMATDYMEMPFSSNTDPRRSFQMIEFVNLSVKYQITGEYLASILQRHRAREPKISQASEQKRKILFICFFAFSSNFI